MKKNIIIIILSVIIVVLAIFMLRFILSGKEDSWICENGEWIKHGNPSEAHPDLPCGKMTDNEEEEPDNKKDENGEEQGEKKNIVVDFPAEGEIVNFPFKISGEARVFENTVRFEIKEKDGGDLFEGFMTANSPDIGQFGAFEKEIGFLLKVPESENVIMYVFWDSPKDGSRLDTVSRPFKLNIGEISAVKVYFSNTKFDPEVSCNKVAPVERIIPKTKAPAMASLELLIEGPVLKEAQANYITSINNGTKINGLNIKDGIAYADFSKTLEENIGGSCKVAAIRAQITETLKQFPNIKEVIISIDGRTEDILQP